MKLKSYKEMYEMSDEERKKFLSPTRVKAVKKAAEKKLADLDNEIADASSKVYEILTGFPIDFEQLVDTFDDKQLAERKQSQISGIITELFPEE